MNADAPSSSSEAALRLREQFNRSFASPHKAQSEETADYLAIRIGTRSLALPVGALSRVEIDRKIVPLPTSDAWLLGLASSQGRLVPVYRLDQALGFASTANDARCFVVIGKSELLALAFDAIEGWVRSGVSVVSFQDGWSAVVRQALPGGEVGLRPLVDVAGVAAAIRRRISESKVEE